MSDDKNYAEMIKELVEETVDRVNEVMAEFGEKCGDIAKEATESERVEKIVDKILEIRSGIADSASDIIKSVTNAIVDTGDSISNLVKKDKSDD